jgi:hypothetical protein
MINWCKQNTLLLLITSSFWGGQSSDVADSMVSKGVECNNINTAYQEVYRFETENHYINICQLDSDFYYYRQSKSDVNNHLLIPAEVLVRGDVFQATAGKTTYFVGMDSDRYYSSVMSHDNEIVFEPEIVTAAPVASATTPKTIAQMSSSITLPGDYNLTQADDKILINTSLDLDHPEAEAEAEELLICTQEKSAFHPRLQGWEKLIGKSTSSVDKHAVKNGQQFTYNQENPDLALITTQDGETINLSINVSSNSGVVEQVCVPAEAKNRSFSR